MCKYNKNALACRYSPYIKEKRAQQSTYTSHDSNSFIKLFCEQLVIESFRSTR